MADHGEAFGEHGENHHGIFLYDETIHVPMLFKLPGRHTAATVEAPVGLVDVTPSILQAVHLPVPAAVQGKSLMKYMASGTQRLRKSRTIRTRNARSMRRAAMVSSLLSGAR